MIKIKMHGENKHDKKIEKKRKQMNAGGAAILRGCA